MFYTIIDYVCSHGSVTLNEIYPIQSLILGTDQDIFSFFSEGSFTSMKTKVLHYPIQIVPSSIRYALSNGQQ